MSAPGVPDDAECVDPPGTEAKVCVSCPSWQQQPATGNCKGGLCEECCQSNRGDGPFNCCDGAYPTSAEATVADKAFKAEFGQLFEKAMSSLKKGIDALPDGTESEESLLDRYRRKRLRPEDEDTTDEEFGAQPEDDDTTACILF